TGQPYHPGDSFFSVFGLNLPGNPTLLQVLGLKGGGINALSRSAVAAILNASDPLVGYPLTTSQIIAAYQTAVASGDGSQIEALKNLLDGYNNAGCTVDADGNVIVR
ncbi:MAG: hypothetical protein M3P30_08265, partial [Chloroflexota bacterium]|nr:hypothetical protein [Chloroflexota bacterium]